LFFKGYLVIKTLEPLSVQIAILRLLREFPVRWRETLKHKQLTLLLASVSVDGLTTCCYQEGHR